MYIRIGTANYPCTGRRQDKNTVTFFAGGLPDTVSGAVRLCREDGFELAGYDTGDWLRVAADAASLTLTNLPEPEAPPEPVEPETPGMTAQEAELDMLTEIDYRLSLVELGLVGGGANA